MANRKTGLDWVAGTVFGVAVLADTSSFRYEAENQTAEGKGIADIDAWPVLTGRTGTFTLDVMVPAPGTAVWAGTALASTPAGAFSFNTGAGTYAGTAVLTRLGHVTERDGIQVQNLTLATRGAVTFS